MGSREKLVSSRIEGSRCKKKEGERERERLSLFWQRLLVLGEMNSHLQVNLSPDGPSEQHLPCSEY